MACDPLKNPPENVRLRAQREVELMRLLQSGPMLKRDIAKQMGINPRTIQSMVNDLRTAGVIHRRPGSHQIVLSSGEFFDVEPDPQLAWMQM